MDSTEAGPTGKNDEIMGSQSLMGISRRLSAIANLLMASSTRKLQPTAVNRTSSGKTADDVVARMEILPVTTVKPLFRVVFLGVFFSFLILVVQGGLKIGGKFKLSRTWIRVGVVNLAIGTLCMLVMLMSLGHYIYR